LVLAQPVKRLRKEVVVISFHPTLVLAQLADIYQYIGILSRFHPTLVLAQLMARVAFFSSGQGFPSHIGSRSTKTHRGGLMKLQSFHPTLVLAQPKAVS